MKSAYIFGLLQALHNYDPENGASFNSFQAYYTIEAIDDYIRTMRTGYTIPSGDEYALLRKAMALYAKYGYKSTVLLMHATIHQQLALCSQR